MFYGLLRGDKIYSAGHIGEHIKGMLAPYGQNRDPSDEWFAHKSSFHCIHRMLWLRGVSLPPPATTLDIGCGGGPAFGICAAQGMPGACHEYGSFGDEQRWIYSLGFTGPPHEGCAGLDVQETLASSNQQYGIQCIVGEISKSLPRVATDAYDQVIGTEIIEHLPRNYWPEFLQEIMRIARYQVLLTTPDWEADSPKGREEVPGEVELYGWETHLYVPNNEEWLAFFDEIKAPLVEAYRIPGAFVARICTRRIPGVRS